jgi:hypothetical protein
MLIRIYDWGNYTWDSYNNESQIGLKLDKYNRMEVIDKQLFMLAIIKYGIVYKETKYYT